MKSKRPLRVKGGLKFKINLQERIFQGNQVTILFTNSLPSKEKLCERSFAFDYTPMKGRETP